MFRVQRTKSVLDLPHDGHGDRHESFDACERDVLPRQRGGHPLHTASGKRVLLLRLKKGGCSGELARMTLVQRVTRWSGVRRAVPFVAFVKVSITTATTPDTMLKLLKTRS